MQIRLYPNQEIRCTWGGGHVPVRVDERRDARGFAPSLDIPPQPSQAKPRGDFKRHPLTQKARHRILHHGGLFSDRDRKRQIFLTGTLPGSTDGALQGFTDLAPYVVKLVQTYMPRAIGVKAKELRYIWVWELQKRGALHMHLIVECPTRKKAKEMLLEWRGVWVSMLRAAAKKAKCDIFERKYGGTHKDNESVWQIKAERVKKSVARYLSKYESKGSDGERKYFPPRWYGISSALRRDMKGWMQGNTFWDAGRISEDAGVDAARAVVGDLLKEFCVGEVTHKHGFGEVGGVDVFGYLRENTQFEDVCDFVTGMCQYLGLKVKQRKLEPIMADFARETRRMARNLEAEMPPEILLEYQNQVTLTIWQRMQDTQEGGISDYRQAYWAYTYLLLQKGYKWNNQPSWVSILNQDWNRSRERFADILEDS